jgi:tetratricopeptide (TPR) repeat protein
LQASAVGDLAGFGHLRADPDTLNSRNSLAAAYLAAGRVAEAIPLFEQILAVQQRTLGPGDSETLTSQNNLASAYQDAGRTAEAIRLYELNLEIRERLLGPDHPSTLNSRANLAAAYRDGGRVGEAIPLLEQTLAARERVLGPEDPDTQATRKKLATAYQDTGRAAEAVPLLERTSAERRRIPRSDHPGADQRKNLAEADRAATGRDTIPARADPGRPRASHLMGRRADASHPRLRRSGQAGASRSLPPPPPLGRQRFRRYRTRRSSCPTVHPPADTGTAHEVGQHDREVVRVTAGDPRASPWHTTGTRGPVRLSTGSCTTSGRGRA